jgi:probable rRNA maturation factor
MTIDITIEDDGWSELANLEALGEEIAKRLLKLTDGDVAVLFTNDAAMQALNREFRNKDKATNVLSFPFHANGPQPKDMPKSLGDIALGFETVKREAAEQGKSLNDHTSHLLVHGILHLMDYDHQTEAEAEVMEQREREILASLGIKDPYET